MTTTHHTVTKDGIAWKVMGRTSRATTHNGKHYLAVRCREGNPWRILHTEHDISVAGSTKYFGTIAKQIHTKDLSKAVLQATKVATN